ncbi:MAG TPA: autotransporter-associated beta strand repeat-containing protein [Kiritimatiellia bacterium]|nr:autotransporter-associated beta strand repeat-containing protein [Kiritimatiellia bacterium]HPS08184.1 autotransporter-associated beta strand repeat-containing protein [Kiritimatiellia bacterium]
MNQHPAFGKWAAAVMAAFGLATGDAQAWTIVKSNSDQPYTASDADLLQRNLNSVETDGLAVYVEGGYTAGTLASLTDGTTGPGNREFSFALAGGSITYTLDTSKSPAGYLISSLGSYTGWQDGGRVDQNYVVSFRKVASGTFENAITNTYASGMRETRISLTDLNLAGIDAVKFTFLTQENGGVGYKELDVFGAAMTTQFSATGTSAGTVFTVSDSDLIQTAVSATNDAFSYYTSSGFTNALVPALTDGAFGSADRTTGTCAIASGTVTYTLDLTNHPAGYTVAAIDTYTGWSDSGRDNQNYWVSFRKTGASAFGDAMEIAYTGTVKLTHVAVTNLNLADIDAVRFTFPPQENSGVGYKELDVIGAPPDYTEVTRRDSGTQVVASNDTADVLITEGSGTAGTLTLGAGETIISTLTQGATDGLVTIDPSGQTLSLSGLFLRPDAGGLMVGTGASDGSLVGTQPALAVGNWSTNDLAIRATVTNRTSAGTLLKSGTGTLTLYGTNTCPGGTEVTGGSLRLPSGGSLGSGPVKISHATLQLDGGTVAPAAGNAFCLSMADATFYQTAGSLSYNGYAQFQNAAIILSGGTSYVGTDTLLGWGGTNTATIIGGSHTANWRVTRFSSGSVSVTLQSGGRLYSDRLYSSAGATGSLFFDGGVLGMSSITPGLYPNDWIGATSGTLSLYVKDGGAIIDTANGSATIRRPFLRDGASTGGLTKTGGNTLTLMITNAATFCTYAGDTTVLGGTLKLGPASAPLPTGTRLNISADAVLDLNSANQTVGELTGGGRVMNASSTNALFTVGGNNTSTNFPGLLEGAITLVKTGTGTLTLSGANTFTNSARVLGGTLQLAPLPVTIRNAGFELPAMGAAGWAYLTGDSVTGGWTMSGHPIENNGSGIARNGSPWVGTAPQGFQIGFLQSASHCFQTVTVQRAGTYQLAFAAANRPGYPAANVEVLVDGSSTASWSSAAFANGGAFKSYTTNFALTAGTHELRFQGTSAGGDTTTTIDDIRLVGAGPSAPGNLPTNILMEIAADAVLDLGGTRQPLAGLSGCGTVSNGTLAVQGVIAPGGTNAVGTLTLAAAATLSGTLLVDAALDGSCDRLQVSGALDVSGLTLEIQNPAVLKPGATYVIATCTPGSLSGQFLSTNLSGQRTVGYNNAAGQVLLTCGGTLISIH